MQEVIEQNRGLIQKKKNSNEASICKSKGIKISKILLNLLSYTDVCFTTELRPDDG